MSTYSRMPGVNYEKSCPRTPPSCVKALVLRNARRYTNLIDPETAFWREVERPENFGLESRSTFHLRRGTAPLWPSERFPTLVTFESVCVNMGAHYFVAAVPSDANLGGEIFLWFSISCSEATDPEAANSTQEAIR